MSLAAGAEVLAEVLGRSAYSTVFAYPGTSELALCSAIAGRDDLRLVNARGDKEAAFMAAGGNLQGRPASAAILHGARGLTNALGAVADVRRSEVPVLYLVGMPSRSSARYLPPHGEPALIEHAGAFARSVVDCSTMEGLDPRVFLSLVGQAFEALGRAPYGPVLVGLPQDVLTSRFVPSHLLAGVAQAQPTRSDPQIDDALVSIESAERPVILVDDYLLRSPTADHDLARFATRLGAPVLQAAYRRGPMFFQQLRSTVPTYLGQYDPRDVQHRALLEEADLVVTVEDRNLYPRVVGRLPDCRKVAITSNRAATVKNGYLRPSDVLVVGETLTILRRLTERLAGPDRCPPRDAGPVSVRVDPSPGEPPIGGASGGHGASSDEFARAIACGLHAVPSVAIVDDSQMFGGLLARNYRHLPTSVRVFASHGGFVGGGLATAAGLALAHPNVAVVATLGDQGFTNGVQALAAVREQQIPLLVLVCNNGSSVSLMTQATADGLDDDRVRSVLGNASELGYAAIARGFGIPATKQVWPGDPTGQDLAEASQRLTDAIADAFATGGPHVLELVTPDSPQFWAGVWRVTGFEESVQAPPRPGPVRDGSAPPVGSRVTAAP